MSEFPKKTNIQHGQIFALREFFENNTAETWSSKIRNSWFKALQAETIFSNISINRIRYQWSKFQAEFLLRRQVVREYSRASVALASEQHVREVIYDIISHWLDPFMCCTDVTYNVPTNILYLIRRCVQITLLLATISQAKQIKNYLLYHDQQILLA
jgi:hypothetical protein